MPVGWSKKVQQVDSGASFGHSLQEAAHLSAWRALSKRAASAPLLVKCPHRKAKKRTHPAAAGEADWALIPCGGSLFARACAAYAGDPPPALPQVGRAGRDGSEASCFAFLSDADFVKLRSLAFSGLLEQSTVRAFLEVLFAEDAPRQPRAQVRQCRRWAFRA